MTKIECLTRKFAEEVMEMMRIFYSSPAVSTNGSDEIFKRDIEQCLSDNPYLEGYVFVENNSAVGYAMVVKSFSTEFGKSCIWIEDIYLKPEFCGLGMGTEFIKFIEKKYSNAILRLEVEEDNRAAVHTYYKNGFEVLPYMEMVKK